MAAFTPANMANMTNELSDVTASSSVSMSVTSVQDQDADCEYRVCLVGEKTVDNQQLLQDLQTLSLPFTTSETGIENVMEPAGVETIFVLDEFEGEAFENLRRSGCKILGPPVTYQCAANKQPLPFTSRPLYCCHMSQLVICFTGFVEKEELKRLAELVHHMGGSVRRDFSTKVTHLVANATTGNKFRVAVSLGTPVMTKEWIYTAWQNRHDTQISATTEAMLQYKMPPFFHCVLSFVGFSADEQKHMEEVTVTQGGTHVAIGGTNCTHLVIENNATIEMATNHDVKLVKQEWFWASVQMDACADETLYMYHKTVGSDEVPKTPGTTPVMHTSRKRRRLKESLAALSQENDDLASPRMPSKRRSSTLHVHDPSTVMSMSASSLLDATPDESLAGNEPCTPMQVDDTPVTRSTPEKPISKRHLTAMELLQTEANYVGILRTILTVFKEPLEKEQTGGPILDQEEIKTIFSKIPEIHEVHQRLQEDLEKLLDDYSEDKSIAEIIIKHSADIMKAYPAFVNFFELSKQTVIECDKQKPRFHAFLKICQSKPECGRQTLTELLIRPVQRLPSMILLLSDLHKRTPEGHTEWKQLSQALDSLRKVAEHINEDKRKTEGHTQMFEVINDIEDVPPHLLSAHRSFIMRADMTEIGDKENGKGENFSEKGGNISMFLFSDTLEICKRRGKPGTSFKSPHSSKAPQKFYKHIELVPLSHIRRILDVQETEECKNTFAILCKPPMDTTERLDHLYLFTLIREEPKKEDWLKTLCKHIANVTCKTDAENFLTKITPEELEITKSDFDKGKLTKAMRRARRATRKVGRTFSFNKTPRRTLQRAASTTTLNMSPMVTKVDLAHPAEHMDLTGARLASTSSLNAKVTSPLSTLPPCTPGKLKSVTYGSSSANWL
ncbi:protein ECT2-like [Acanthaster planci]|uniref:Protein ECT2-like n=1 Tax=Acanthaster planci TaxID=133434 RepID=A0A8B7YZ86_ACAPL|nr:protein ECT2-like [Acanthaster planci]